MTEAQTSNYWISPNALRITLNAMGLKDYIQCSATSGAVIMCFMRDIDGLDYDAGHNYRRWPLSTAPTFFNSTTHKYVYVAIPRNSAVASHAQLVFPSEKIDIYGYTEKIVPVRDINGNMLDENGNITTDINKAAKTTEPDKQIGNSRYYYIFLQGIISASVSESGADQMREWEDGHHINYGSLSTDQATKEVDGTWWRYLADDDKVEFLKTITNAVIEKLHVVKEFIVDSAAQFKSSVRIGGTLSVVGNATINGLLTAYNTIINDIKSSNFSGTGIADTGFQITNSWGESGDSGAIFDYLTVRKKMIINSLEIKETHFSGGDMAQSCATAELYRTDYYQVDGNGNYTLLGYSVVKVPWYIKGVSFLLGKNPLKGVYSKKKTIRMTLTENQLKNCNRIRCYFLSKDGEKNVENWWRVDDLARCQTWNVIKTQRDTYTPVIDGDDISNHEGNIYWWRKVHNVSWNTGLPRYLDANGNVTTVESDAYINENNLPRIASSGTYVPEPKREDYPTQEAYLAALADFEAHGPVKIDGKECHWFDVDFDYEREKDANKYGRKTTWCDLYSDIPAAGDKVVQFGNTTDPDRMNIILYEVNGMGNPDAPGIKMYRGIYTFDLNESWWGNVHQPPIQLSPGTRIRLYAPILEYGTEYGTARVTMPRSEGYWTRIFQEYDDFTGSVPLDNYPDYSDDIIDAHGAFVSRGGWTLSGDIEREGSAENPIPRNYVRKCYNSDQISHKGSIWLCVIAESHHWRVQKGKTLTVSIGTGGKARTYVEYDEIPNDVFKGLTEDQKHLLEYVRSYTTDEPSYVSNDWREMIQKGGFVSRVFLRSNNIPLPPRNDTPEGSTYNTYDNPVPPPQQHAIGGKVVTEEWTDGIPDGEEMLWSSTARFYSNTEHEDWSTPARETDTATLDIEFSPNYNQPATPYGDDARQKDSDDYQTRRHGQGWYDPSLDAQAQGIDWDDMIWRAERQIKNGEYTGTWTITRIKGEKGTTPLTAFRWYKDDAIVQTAPMAPVEPQSGDKTEPVATDHISDGNAQPAAKWSKSAPNRPDNGWSLWMTTSSLFDDGSYGAWTPPVRISGATGSPGEDAADIEWIYKVYPTDNIQIPASSGSGTAPDSSKTSGWTAAEVAATNGWVPEGWTNHPTGIDSTNIFELACFRTKAAGSNVDPTKKWSKWKGIANGGANDTPIIWSHWGRNGMDGDGFEYVFIRTKTNVAPVIIGDESYIDSNGKVYETEGHLPHVEGNVNIENNKNNYECTDDPNGVNEIWKYEWVAKRTMKSPDGESGVRKWDFYKSEAMKAWGNHADNVVRLDIDNEMDTVITDAAGKPTRTQEISTVVSLFEGLKSVKIPYDTITVDSIFVGLKNLIQPTQVQFPDNDGDSVKLVWTLDDTMTISDKYDINIRYTYKDAEYQCVFTLTASKGAEIFQLKPDKNSIPFRRNDQNELTPLYVTVGLKIVKTDTNGIESEYTSAADAGIKVRYSTEAMPTAINEGSEWKSDTLTPLSVANTKEYLYLAAFSLESVLLDRETIPVIKDGYNGDGIVGVTRKYAVSAYNEPNAQGMEYPTDITSWKDTSDPVTDEKPYLWAKEVIDYKYAADTEHYYYIGKKGDNGVDAKDAEWAYIRTKTATPPVIADDSIYYDSQTDTKHPNGRNYEEDDHLPHVTGNANIEKNNSDPGNPDPAKPYECTDDPKGVNNTWKYEWEIKRTKGNADGNGHRVWNYYKGTMTLHNNLAESELVIDIDNDNDQIGTDSESRVVDVQTKTTNVTMLYGTEEQDFTEQPTAKLYWDNGTEINDSSIAVVSVSKVYNWKYLVTASIKKTPDSSIIMPWASHNGCYVEISGTCSKGTKTIRFSLEKLMSGKPGVSPTIYQLALSGRSFSFGRSATNELVAKSNSITVRIKETIGNNSVISSLYDSGLTCAFKLENETEESTVGSDGVVTISPASVCKNTKVIFTLVGKGDVEEVPIVVDGTNGADGNSITKEDETYRYAVTETNIRPTESGTESTAVLNKWYDKRSKVVGLWTQGRYLWTETTILWSDGSTTKLYSDERNPNDGLAGQDIVVDGPTVMKYCCKDSNTIDPEAIPSSDWKDYSQVTKTKGWWLWSKATTNYKKATTGESAGTSANYNVSYIATDGTSVTFDEEHSSVKYAVSDYGAPEAGRVYPSDITSWSITMPAVQKGKYLWTQDITAYNDGGTIRTTTTYGVSYWGTDVEIDTTRTFVKYCRQTASQYTGEYPADSDFNTSFPSSLGQGDYLWTLNQVAYVGDSNVYKSYSVSMLGTDGDKGDEGADGYTTHFAYATSSDGSQGFSTTNFAGAKYIGTYRDDSPTDSTNYRDYTWTQWRGNDGTSITKKSEVKAYQVSTNGITVPTGTWLDEAHKPTPTQGQFLWTRTTITWSDNSTTVLYSAERNPNDGIAGTSISISSQSVTYSKQMAGNLDPTTLTYGNYPSSLAKGDWLYCKTTVNYSDNTHTDAYNVSYIGTDGDHGSAGKGISSITEYYAVNNDKDIAPTSGWSTSVPSTWDIDHKYLWNYEETAYTTGSPTSTTKKVIAIFTKNGRGIDSVTNHYLATNLSSGVTKSTSGWTASVQAVTKDNRYLWNYETITYVDGTPATSDTDPRIIGVYGDSVTAQYAPNNNPTSEQIHNTFQNGDKYMRTISSSDTSWSAWQKIVGENGENGDYIDSSFAISASLTTANVNTKPSDTPAAANWSDSPVATTSAKPYMWCQQVSHTFSNGTETVGTPTYFRMTGEEGTPADVWTIGSDGYWYKNGVKQSTKAEGTDGTGVEIKGGVDKYYTTTGKTSLQSLNTSELEYGDCYIVNDDTDSTHGGHLYFYQGGTWPDNWRDLGKIKGEPGTSSYMHIAYADSVTLDAQGNPTACEGFTTTKDNREYPWLGLCTDGNIADPDQYTSYEWNKVKGGQGNPGRAMTGSSEHYKVSSNDGSTGHQEVKPIADGQENASLEWTTDPNAAIANWGENAKYLWNYEKTTYSSGTTPMRTTPHIIAIWTEDGADGRGIDDITNKYKVTGTDYTSDDLKRVDQGGTGWDDNPITPMEGQILWNYEIITWTSGTQTTYTDVHQIGYSGTNGINPTLITVYKEAESTPATPAGGSPAQAPNGWSLVEPRVGRKYNMDALEFVNSSSGAILSRKFLVANNSGDAAKLTIKFGVTNSNYSTDVMSVKFNNIENQNKSIGPHASTPSLVTVTYDVASGATADVEVILERRNTDSRSVGCFDISGAGLDISPMYLWESSAAFYAGIISDEGWSTPVTFTAKNATQPDSGASEYIYIRSKQMAVKPIVDDSDTYDGKTKDDDDYLPKVGNYGTDNPYQFESVRWTDEPKGVNDDWKYEFEAKRNRVNKIWKGFEQIVLKNSFGKEGRPAVSVKMTPASMIINQDLTNPNNIAISNNNDLGRFEFEVYVGEDRAEMTKVKVAPTNIAFSRFGSTVVYEAEQEFRMDDYLTETLIIRGIKTKPDGSGYYDNGQLELREIEYTDPIDGLSKKVYNVLAKIYVNLLGTWKTMVEGDTETSIAHKLTQGYDSSSQTDIPLETFGTYIRSSEVNISTLTKVVNDGKNLLSGVLTGTGWKSMMSSTYSSGTPMNDVSVDDDGYMNASGSDKYIEKDVLLSSNTEYTLSFYSKTTTAITITVFIVGFPSMYLTETIAASSVSTRKITSFTIPQGWSGTFGISINATTVKNPQVELGDTATDFEASTTETVSQIKQTTEEIDLSITNKLGETGININGTNRNIKLQADRVTFVASDGTTGGKISIDPTTGALNATDGNFSGTVTATGGTIGGFTIESTTNSKRLYNSDWEASIEMDYDGKSVKIGKSAQGTVNTEQAIIRAENTKSGETYNTALYMNAQNASYNYAFYGNGNGVLNGYMQGYKCGGIEITGQNTYLYLEKGTVQCINKIVYNDDKNVYLPTLANIRACLGIVANASTTNFCCQLTIINQSEIGGTSVFINKDNVYVKGGTHNFDTEITAVSARPRIMRGTGDDYVELEGRTNIIFFITYVNKKFIANYIKG